MTQIQKMPAPCPRCGRRVAKTYQKGWCRDCLEERFKTLRRVLDRLPVRHVKRPVKEVAP